MHKILIIGATGMLGKPVTEVLIQQNFEVTILVRNRKRALKLFPDTRLKIVEGDIKNESSLRTAIQGKDAIYLSLSVSPTEKPDDFHPELNGLRLILRVAEDQRVKRVLYLSSLVGKHDNDWWVLKLKKKAVNSLRMGRVPFTIFYPSNFMEAIVHQYKSGNKLNLIGKANYPLHWISAKDYGKQVAKAIQIDQGNVEYVIQGPEAITIENAFKRFIQHYHAEKLSIRKLPVTFMKMMKMFGANLDYGIRISESINNYPEEFQADVAWAKLGKPETTIEEFARIYNEKVIADEVEMTEVIT